MKNEIFITKALKKHGNKYNYSLVDYKNSKTKINIICNIHGEFSQTPNSHLNGRGCPECSQISRGIPAKLNNETFIKKAILAHGDLYSYDDLEYSNISKPVKIRCLIHEDFFQIPRNHLNGSGCPECGKTKRNKSILVGTKRFIEKSREVHGKKYDYSKSKYEGSRKEIIVICGEHGEFLITPAHHYIGSGCKKCSKSYKRSTQEFIDDSIKIHSDKYEYDKTIFYSTDSPVKIRCKKHGYFKQKAARHLNGHGCPRCSESKGEMMISGILISHGLEFIQQKKFSDCRSRKGNKLRFDFYIPSLNICIEFDGQQHFEKIDFFGNDEKFKTQIENDLIKNDYCSRNQIELIRIKYNEVNIKKLIINKIFKKMT